MSRVMLITAVAILALTACSTAAEQDATRDESGAVSENEDIGVFRLRQGDCLVMPGLGIGGQEVETLEAIPCAELHDGEVLDVVDMTGGDDAPFPGSTVVSAEAETACLASFERRTGRDFITDPEWDMTYLSPTEDSWTLGGDREIVCIAVPLDGELTTALVTDDLLTG